MSTRLTLFVFLGILHNMFCLDYDGWMIIKLEHNLNCNGEEFCDRGTISMKSLRTGTFTIDQIQFDRNHLEALKQTADIDGFYTVRSTVKSAEVNNAEFISSMKAQCYLDSGLSDIINLWVLPNSGVMAVHFQVANNTLDHRTLPQNAATYLLNTNFLVNYVEQAPVPDTTSYIQKLEREREAREKGDTKDYRSFLAKYWMYIVPIVIFVMISGAANPEPPAQASR